MSEGLVYIGKIIDLKPIPNADFIVSATVVCGAGGKWRGIVRRSDFTCLGEPCIVFLPDSQLNPEVHFCLTFMKDSGWHVKMRRFKGTPSEVLIIPLDNDKPYVKREELLDIGTDITERMQVTKYHKPIPAHLNGIAKGPFPSFIPKTDEQNYQSNPELVDALIGKPYYITEKADGSSTTAFKWKGQFGLCSRNLELERNPENGYWKVAIKYGLEEKLPDGIALQWETCGPGIQSNPMGLPEIDGFAFSAYNIEEHRYLEMTEFWSLIDFLGFRICPIVGLNISFSKEGIESLGEGFYKNKNPREGVVVRSQENMENGRPISFKVINLDYER